MCNHGIATCNTCLVKYEELAQRSDHRNLFLDIYDVNFLSL
jgi:hypothetical protein